MSDDTYLLDTSALLTLIEDEAGAARVEEQPVEKVDVGPAGGLKPGSKHIKTDVFGVQTRGRNRFKVVFQHAGVFLILGKRVSVEGAGCPGALRS